MKLSTKRFCIGFPVRCSATRPVALATSAGWPTEVRSGAIVAEPTVCGLPRGLPIRLVMFPRYPCHLTATYRPPAPGTPACSHQKSKTGAPGPGLRNRRPQIRLSRDEVEAPLLVSGPSGSTIGLPRAQRPLAPATGRRHGKSFLAVDAQAASCGLGVMPLPRQPDSPSPAIAEPATAPPPTRAAVVACAPPLALFVLVTDHPLAHHQPVHTPDARSPRDATRAWGRRASRLAPARTINGMTPPVLPRTLERFPQQLNSMRIPFPAFISESESKLA